MALAFRFITFLSDYGLEDEFVGVCRGVIKRFAPEVEILDVAHGIPPQDIHAGATVLAQAVRYMPAAVHLAVVDPGVGTNRRQVVLGTKNGPPLVGPDNGLLCPAADALGGATQAFSIENRDLFLQAPSRTFHGRDIFAPVAARLALGMAPEEVGPRIDVESLVKLKQRQADVHERTRLRADLRQRVQRSAAGTVDRPRGFLPLDDTRCQPREREHARGSASRRRRRARSQTESGDLVRPAIGCARWRNGF
ncbi:MAG: SAM-dependent chlorinase/fluorinase [Actinobacteria bacterium]|nr:SAM-dependent chlorinase/fluorinase [Actinomycetota bacterium]